MFERFTHDARATVVGALELARDRGDGFIASHHLLLAVASTPGPAATALSRHGLDIAIIEARTTGPDLSDDIDADALRTVGIDLDEVRQRVEDSFGEGALEDRGATTRPRRTRRRRTGSGHIPFTDDAKASLEQSLQAALRLGHREINSSHLVLGILACGSGAGGRLLIQAATPELRVSLEAAARPAA